MPGLRAAGSSMQARFNWVTCATRSIVQCIPEIVIFFFLSFFLPPCLVFLSLSCSLPLFQERLAAPIPCTPQGIDCILFWEEWTLTIDKGRHYRNCPTYTLIRFSGLFTGRWCKKHWKQCKKEKKKTRGERFKGNPSEYLSKRWWGPERLWRSPRSKTGRFSGQMGGVGKRKSGYF